MGPSYYLNTKGLYEQRGDEDAEQFYARIMTTLEEFMDRYGETLHEWANPRLQGLLMPGQAPAKDESSAFQFEHPRLKEERALGSILGEIADRGSLEGMANQIEGAVAEYAQAYLRAYTKRSFNQFKNYCKETRA